jgi:hypothetical protein
MKKLMSFVVVALILLCGFGAAQADNAEYRLVVNTNSMTVGGDFWLDLQMRISSGTTTRTLSSITVNVYYTSSLTPWSTVFPGTNWGPASGLGYASTVDKLSGRYLVTVVGNSVGTAGEGDPPGWNVTDSWQRVVTMRWKIASLTPPVTITIDDGTDAGGYFVSLNNNPPAGVVEWAVSNQDLGDVSLPVQMTGFTAQATSREGVTLNWITESETNSAGFHIWRGESENAISLRVTSALIPSHGNSSSRNEYTFTDRDAHGKTFWYKIEEVSHDGQSQFLGPIAVEAAMPLPEQFSVSRNYPNPFNPETTVHYELPEDASVSVRVFDLMGREVKTLTDGHVSAGRYDAKWDGTNQFGNAVSSGMYFIRVQAGEFSAVRKMTLMR